MSLQDDVRQFERLKLKLQINKYLLKWGKEYSSHLFYTLRAGDLTFFNAVVDEMAAEGTLTKQTGPQSAVILVYRDVSQGVEPCQKS
ncbi:MAG: hypothetical protein LAP86_19495 [Acidobacteriia bacterium]|nr:hypothetical protein [Terriglobia bacterium]